jgi:hypothetical protein
MKSSRPFPRRKTRDRLSFIVHIHRRKCRLTNQNIFYKILSEESPAVSGRSKSGGAAAVASFPRAMET